MATSASINISPSTHVSGPVASPRIGSIGNGSFRDAVAGSLGREVSHIMDYSLSKFGTSASSDITVAPSTSYGHKLDTTFCRSFQCCGKPLEDLHELLAHYEEEHTRDNFDDDLTESMDDAMSDDGSSRSSKSPSPRMINSTPALLKRKAFDTGEDSDVHTLLSSKKRSYGSFSLNGPTSANVHQSLRRALIDGGVGSRRVPGSPSIYSANSPFSTPGSSIPGTPAVDQENEAYFSGALAANAFAGLSLRTAANEDHQMPSCAPPNLFFPAAGGSNSSMNGPPSKRERINNGTAVIPSPSTPSVAAASSSAAVTSAHDALSKVSGNNNNNIDSKPFKCPEPGCDKAYKQMNGLKYHKLHGHCNQNNLPPALQTQAAHLKNAANGTGSVPNSPLAARKPGDSRQGTPGMSGDIGEPSTPTGSTPGSPRASLAAGGSAAAAAAAAAANATPEKMYLCQVGSCGKRYKNLNGLRYHYLHSGSHGLLGLQLLHANGGGASAKMDPATGNATVSTLNLSEEAVAAAARAAAEQQAARVQKLHALQNAQKAAAAVAAAANPAGGAPAGTAAAGTPSLASTTGVNGIAGAPGTAAALKAGTLPAVGGLPGLPASSAAGLAKAATANVPGFSSAATSAAGTAAPVKLSAALNEMPDMPTLPVVNVSHPANAGVSGNSAAVQALAASTAGAIGKSSVTTSASTATATASGVSAGNSSVAAPSAATPIATSSSTPGIAIPTAPGGAHAHLLSHHHQRLPTLAPAPLPGSSTLVSPPSSGLSGLGGVGSSGGMGLMDLDVAPGHPSLSGRAGSNPLSTLVSPSNGMLSSLSTSAGGLLGSTGMSLGASSMDDL